MKRLGFAGVALATMFLMMVGSAWAEAPATICVPEASSKQVLSTNTKGECPTKTISKMLVKYKSEALPGPAELAKLDKILPHLNFVESGVGGKPTVQFSGINVQVVNGEGTTATANGAGNLVIGYDENTGGHSQVGSHNLILGEEQTFTSYGGMIAGRGNSSTAPYASVTGGAGNTASGTAASVTGGSNNLASETYSSVNGGRVNTASSTWAAVSGGHENSASGEDSTVSGGVENRAVAGASSVSGGEQNYAGATFSWVGGGYRNNASGSWSSIFGGRELFAPTAYEAKP